MVRVNLIKPRSLADQHLIAEYAEILMLVEYIRKYPVVKEMPKNFTLGKGHMIFFKNKVGYLKKRHELLKKEMQNRGFLPSRKVIMKSIPQKLINDWRPDEKDKNIIRKRLIQRIKEKPKFYRYYGEYKPKEFFIKKIKKK